RDLDRWKRNVRDMVASGADFQLVTTFNEWGEGTAVESALEWESASGFGTYLDALHANGASLPAAPVPTAAPPLATPTVTATAPPPSAVPPAGPTPGPAPTPSPPPVPTAAPTPPPGRGWQAWWRGAAWLRTRWGLSLEATTSRSV